MEPPEQILRRSFKSPITSSGWTITLADYQVTLTGGTHGDAYGPVTFPIGLLWQLLADLQHGCRLPETPSEGADDA